MKIFLYGAFTTIIVYLMLELLLGFSGIQIQDTTGELRSSINQVLAVSFICGALTETIKQIKE